MKAQDDYWSYEAILARQLAIFEKHDAKQRALATQTKAEKAKAKLEKQPLENVLKADAQSSRKAIERTEEAFREAWDIARHREVVELANTRAIEHAWAQQQLERMADRRYDPTGNWGKPNYKTDPND
jgi:hypothetical protein